MAPRGSRAALRPVGWIAAALLAACGGGGAGGSGAAAPTTGGLTVLLHDRPTEDVQHVYVTIDRVEARREVDGTAPPTAARRDGRGGRDGEGQGDGKDERGKDDGQDDNDVVEIVAAVPGQYDLLELQHGVEAVLGSGQFEPGHYHSIRLILARDTRDDLETLPADALKNYVVVAGTPYPLVVPSGEQTGIKLGHDFTIEAGVTTTLTLDFDVRQSVHRCGRNHVYRLKPRIRVVPKVVDPASDGIAGTVTTTDGSGLPSGTLVSAQQAGVEIASATVGGLGDYAVTGLPDGTYDLVAIAPGYGYASSLGVVVSGGGAAGSHDLAVTPASAGAVYGQATPASDNVTVRLRWNGLLVATIGADPTTGDYLFDNVPAGTYTVEATNGSSTVSGSAVVAGGAGTLLNLGL